MGAGLLAVSQAPIIPVPYRWSRGIISIHTRPDPQTSLGSLARPSSASCHVYQEHSAAQEIQDGRPMVIALSYLPRLPPAVFVPPTTPPHPLPHALSAPLTPLSLSIVLTRSGSRLRSKVKPQRPSGVLLLFSQVDSSPLRRCTQRCGCGDAARTTEARSDGLYSTLQYNCSTCWSGRAPPTPSNPNQQNIHRPICCIRNVCISIWTCRK